MSQEFDVHYVEEEFKTVSSGIGAIQAVLTGNDIHAKERLLFYLDWYMDPNPKHTCGRTACEAAPLPDKNEGRCIKAAVF